MKNASDFKKETERKRRSGEKKLKEEWEKNYDPYEGQVKDSM